MTLNKTIYGIIVGAVLPFLTTWLFYGFGYTGQLPILTFLKQMFFIKGMGMLIAVSCLPNLAVFSIFVNIEKLNFARGVFLSTLFFAFLIVIFKFVF